MIFPYNAIKINEKWSFNSNFVFQTVNPPIINWQFEFQNLKRWPYYGPRNMQRCLPT